MITVDRKTINKILPLVLLAGALSLAVSIVIFLEPVRNSIVLFVQNTVLRRPINIALWTARFRNFALACIWLFLPLTILAAVFFTAYSKRLLKEEYRIGFAHAAVALIFTAVSIMFVNIMTFPGFNAGESDDFVINVISITRHFSTRVLDSDIQYGKEHFQGIAGYLESAYNAAKGKSGYGYMGGVTPDGRIYGFYFPSYSLACIPAKYFIQFLLPGTDQTWCMLWTNLLFYMAALLFAFHYLRNLENKHRFLVIALLSFSPVLWYVGHASYETFLYSLIVCSAVSLYRGFYKRALFFSAFAASANPSINGLCVAVALCWCYEVIVRARSDRMTFTGMVKHYWFEALGLFACFLPMMANFAYHKILFGKFSYQTSYGAGAGHLSRFIAYLVDLNFGFAGYYPLLLFLFFAGCFWLIWQKKIRFLAFPLAFLLTAAIFSYVRHINCGMAGLHRYNLYITPLLVVFTSVVLVREAPPPPQGKGQKHNNDHLRRFRVVVFCHDGNKLVFQLY